MPQLAGLRLQLQPSLRTVPPAGEEGTLHAAHPSLSPPLAACMPGAAASQVQPDASNNLTMGIRKLS